MNHKENSIAFWDQFFINHEPMTINDSDIKVETKFDQYLKQMGDQCDSVLDIGCGLGTCLISSICFGNKMKKGVGFDTSKHAIHFASETTKKSQIKGLSFHVADEMFLNTLEENSFDGIICSNFLDVIPSDMSERIVMQIKRILKPNGLLLLKLNFYLSEELINKFKMEKIEENTYLMKGIIRSYNLTTDTWIQKFNDFDVLKIDGYQRAETLPEDRIILLSPKSS